jgi:hypothetical protein
VKPSDEFATIVAGTISANTFQLLDAAGEVVAELGTEPAFVDFVGGASLDMRHLDATITDSALAWTQNNPDGSTQQVVLKGPTLTTVTDAPTLLLERTGAGVSRARIRSGRPVASPAPVASVDTFTDTAGNATVQVLATAGGFVDADINLQATGNAGQSALLLDGGTGTASLTAPITAAVRGSAESIIRVGALGPYVQVTGGNVNLGPTTGRLQLGIRTGYLPADVRTLLLPGSLNPMPAFAAFLMNGINVTCAIDDQLVITCTCRIVNVVAGGAAILQPQIFGPGGNIVIPQRIVCSGWVANHDATMSATWHYNVGPLGAGVYVITIIGGQTGGTWALVAPDTWMTADLRMIR